MVMEARQIPSEEMQQWARKLSQSALSLQQELRTQEISLRKLGAGLPIDTLNRLNTVHDELINLTNRIQDQQTELAQLRTLAITTELVNSSLNLDTVLNEVMDQVIQLTGAERGYIMLRDTITGELQPTVVRAIETTDEEGFIISETVIRRVMDSGETVITNNAMEDSRFKSQESIIGFALRSIICTPLKSRDKTIGAIYCDNRVKDGVFGNKEKRLLTGFANQAAIAIENAQYFNQINQALQDITEIKVLLDNILTSIISGVITTDAAGRITTYNAAAESIFHISKEQAVGQWLADALPFIYPHLEAALTEVVEKDTNATIETAVEIDKRGFMTLNMKISPLKNATNEIQGVALVVDDLTELKKRDKTLAAVRRYLPPAMVDNIKSIEKLALGGERRTITVLFVEVRPFDSFPKTLRPSQVMEWLNTYHTIGSEAIHHHAGLIDKYMGNEIMAIFNTQLNPSDQPAWDAVQAALRMAADFRTLSMYATLGEPPTDTLYCRIGIHTGVATVGNVGSLDRREFSAIGDTVNLAKRLQENCVHGQIIVSEVALLQCQKQLAELDWIEVKQLEAIQVKGKTQPVRIYELIDRGV